MVVVATKVGFFRKLREPGEIFEVPDGVTASWFKPVGHEAKPETPARKAAR